MRSRFYADAPAAFYYLPEQLRLKIVGRALGPSGGWFIRDKVIGKMPLHLGHTPQEAKIKDGKVHLTLRSDDGSTRELVTEHVIAATGYKVDLDRLQFLSTEIRSKVKVINRSPVLSSNFESSVPGLYFAGVSAANSFGPVMRFAFGAGFAARTLTRALAKSASKERASIPVARAATTAK
jgi:thioredoxin reductase